MTVEDCIDRDKKYPVHDPKETSRSVSEMKEWTCSKMHKPDGSVIRDCMRLYTGGEEFHVCYSNIKDGDTCLCSSELCNKSTSMRTKLRKLTCQDVIKSSTSLISCLFLIMMFGSYCQTVLTEHSNYISTTKIRNLDRKLQFRVSWQTSIELTI